MARVNRRENPIQPIEFKGSDKDSKELIQAAFTDVESSLDESPDSPTVKKAQRFVELVRSGMGAGVAADRIGTTLKEINSNEDMKNAVKELLTTATIDGNIRQAMVKAGLNKIFMKTVDSPSVKEQKIALEAAKLISASEGIQTPVDQGITIDLGNIWPHIKDLPGPGPVVEKGEEDNGRSEEACKD